MRIVPLLSKHTSVRHPWSGEQGLASDIEILHRGSDGKQSWANLGDWSNAREYGAAARDLAMRVASAAGLGADHLVLDVGFGYGDSLALWLRDGAAAHVDGVEADPLRLQYARNRYRRSIEEGRLTLRRYCGSMQETVCGGSEPAPQARLAGLFDIVLAVDAAYHFPSMSDFVGECVQLARPGARIAMCTVALRHPIKASSRGHSALVRALASAAGIPSRNLLTAEQLRAQAAYLGCSDVRVRDLSAEVLGGFAAFVPAHLKAQSIHPWDRGASRLLATAALCRNAERLGICYHLFSARCPD